MRLLVNAARCGIPLASSRVPLQMVPAGHAMPSTGKMVPGNRMVSTARIAAASGSSDEPHGPCQMAPAGHALCRSNGSRQPHGLRRGNRRCRQQLQRAPWPTLHPQDGRCGCRELRDQLADGHEKQVEAANHLAPPILGS
ncbi:unnamed protein product [Lampetra fluviatilis]